LRNQYRQQIFTLLNANYSLSFNELMIQLGISRPKLAYHLQIMLNNNIITNFYDKRQGIKDHSFYELSAFGKELILTGGLISNSKVYEKEINQHNLVPKMDKKVRSANFRTIRHPRYRSYDKISIRISKNQIQPIQKTEHRFFDPFLNCSIINKSKFQKNETRIQLPTSRKYYIMPFRQIRNIIFVLALSSFFNISHFFKKQPSIPFR